MTSTTFFFESLKMPCYIKMISKYLQIDIVRVFTVRRVKTKTSKQITLFCVVCANVTNKLS